MRTNGTAPLAPRQAAFIQEYLIDFNGKQAAIRSGYSPRSAETHASWLLRNPKVQAVLEAAMQARAERLRVSADKITVELAKIAFADAKDYVPQPGEELDITRLNSDQTTAIQNIQIEDIVDARTGDMRRRTRVRLHDKTAALTTLAKSLGMLSEKHIVEGSLEHIISQLTPAERLERIRQLREKARVEYLPRYEAALRRGGLPAPEQIIDGSRPTSLKLAVKPRRPRKLSTMDRPSRPMPRT